MNEEVVEQLKNEVHLADIANRSYESYLKDHVEKKRLKIFEMFCNTTTDVDSMLTLKHAQMALDDIEQDTLSIISTGKLARIQLEKGK
jgi:hypothetical protein